MAWVCQCHASILSSWRIIVKHSPYSRVVGLRYTRHVSKETNTTAMAARIDVSDETVTLKPGLTIPVSMAVKNLTIPSAPELIGFSFDVNLRYLPDRLTYGIEHLGIRKKNGDLQAVDIRAVPVRELNAAVRMFGMPAGWDSDFVMAGETSPENLKSGDRARLLRFVGFYAAVARLISGDQAKEIARVFDVSQRTASRWIAETKLKGFLD